METKVSWLKRDILLFAVSIGCKADELHFLYELHPDFQVFPTYPVILSFKNDTQEIIDFYAAEKATVYKGIPQFDSTRVVDGQRSLRILKQLPVSSVGKSFMMRKSVEAVYDKGEKGSVLVTLHELMEGGEVYAQIRVWSFYVGQGGWGGERGPKMEGIKMPEREPDEVIERKTTEEMPLLYRLNGDYNPLHATPEPGLAMGFGGVILHGLIAWNVSAHAILRKLCGSEGSRMREFEARFTGPVKGGDKLRVEIWRVGVVEGVGNGEGEEDGWEEIRFQTRGREGKIVLGSGRAVVRPVERRMAEGGKEVWSKL